MNFKDLLMLNKENKDRKNNIVGDLCQIYYIMDKMMGNVVKLCDLRIK